MKKISLLLAVALASTSLLAHQEQKKEITKDTDQHDLELRQLAVETAKTLGLPANDTRAVNDIYTILKAEDAPRAETRSGVTWATVGWTALGIAGLAGAGFGAKKGIDRYRARQAPADTVTVATVPVATKPVDPTTVNPITGVTESVDPVTDESEPVAQVVVTSQHAPNLGDIPKGNWLFRTVHRTYRSFIDAGTSNRHLKLHETKAATPVKPIGAKQRLATALAEAKQLAPAVPAAA